MDKAKFLRMMEIRENIKRKRKALQEWQDIQAVETHRIARVSGRLYNAI